VLKAFYGSIFLQKGSRIARFKVNKSNAEERS
jgi:hypothetical protein